MNFNDFWNSLDAALPWYVIFAILGLVLAWAAENLLLQICAFIVGFGALNLTMASLDWPFALVLVINAVIFIAMGIKSFMLKKRGNIIFGVVLAVIGVFSLGSAFTLFSNVTPSGTIAEVITQSIQQFWNTFMNMIRSASGGT